MQAPVCGRPGCAARVGGKGTRNVVAVWQYTSEGARRSSRGCLDVFTCRAAACMQRACQPPIPGFGSSTRAVRSYCSYVTAFVLVKQQPRTRLQARGKLVTRPRTSHERTILTIRWQPAVFKDRTDRTDRNNRTRAILEHTVSVAPDKAVVIVATCTDHNVIVKYVQTQWYQDS